MSLSLPHYRNSLLSIFLFAALTTYLIFTDRANIFFLIYIFWWDEFLKTLFGLLNRTFQKQRIDNLSAFSNSLKQRLFMLFIYFVFIVVVFGFVLAFKSDTSNAIRNFQILLFHNAGFNAALIFIILRELSTYIFADKNEKITDKSLSFGALTVLHVSIILGMVVWAFASGQFKIYKGVGEHADKFVILPFILIKFFFDWYNLKSAQK